MSAGGCDGHGRAGGAARASAGATPSWAVGGLRAVWNPHLLRTGVRAGRGDRPEPYVRRTY
jgi:hypothetical protein